jgi:hypothetical protein
MQEQIVQNPNVPPPIVPAMFVPLVQRIVSNTLILIARPVPKNKDVGNKMQDLVVPNPNVPPPLVPEMFVPLVQRIV